MVRRTTAMPARLTRLWTKQLYREYTNILHWYDLTQAMAPVALAMRAFGLVPQNLVHILVCHLVLEHLQHDIPRVVSDEMVGNDDRSGRSTPLTIVCDGLYGERHRR